MHEGRTEKIEQEVKEIAARYIERESNKSALITVTRVVAESRGRLATIYITVLPTTGEESALNFFKRHRAELREEVKKRLNIHPVPFLDIAIDTGEKARQTIDALLKQDE